MVWGDMLSTNVGKICFLKRSINAAVSQDTFFIPYIEGKFRDKEFIF